MRGGALSAPRLGYQPALDGLRGIAVAAVVGFHLGFPSDGFLGVDLFFVLSGFLITTLLLEERRERGTVRLRAFYWRRALRLLPALFVFLGIYLAVVIGVAVARGDFSSLGDHLEGVAAGLGYASNIVLAVGGVHALPPGLGHLWSLAAEEQFYLLWPPVLFLLFRARTTLAIASVSAGLILIAARQAQLLHAGVHGDRLDFAPDTRSGSILIGCLFALVLATRARPAVATTARRLAPLAVVLFVVLLIADLGRHLYAGPLMLFGLCSATLIVSVIDGRSLLARLLATRPLVFLGRISYSLYLWHVPIFVAFGINTAERYAAGGVGRKLSAAALAVAAATCSYYFVELPFLRRKAGSRITSDERLGARARSAVRTAARRVHPGPKRARAAAEGSEGR